jgi:chlorophyll synthase
LYVLVVAFAFVVNQISDIRSDTINRKSFILPRGLVSKRQSIGFMGLIFVAAALLSLSSEETLRILVWTGLALGFAYSVPPIRLKARPIWDMMANVAGFGVIGFAMGWLVWAPLSTRLIIHVIPYSLAMAAIFLVTCIPDIEGDRLSGDRTSCVAFGRMSVSRGALVLLAASLVTGLLLDETVCYVGAAGSLPAFVGVAAQPNDQNSVICSQFAGRLFLALVSVSAPVLAGLAVLTYGVSRVYYARRLGVVYPRLEGAPVEPGSHRSR